MFRFKEVSGVTYALVEAVPDLVRGGVKGTVRESHPSVFRTFRAIAAIAGQHQTYISKAKAPTKIEDRNTAFLRKRVLRKESSRQQRQSEVLRH